MRRHKRANNEVTEGPDMTPMLDIVFIMLIFFIVSTSFVKEQAVDWLSPSSSETPPLITDLKQLLISIDENETVRINEREVQIDALLANIQAERAKAEYGQAIIRTHSNAASRLVVQSVDAAKLAGIVSVTVARW